MSIADILSKFRGQPPQVPANAWQDVARQNPNVQAWWSQLIQNHPDMGNQDMIQFMLQDPSGYNYREAILKGFFPEVNPEYGHYHWSDYGKGAGFKAFGESSPRR